MISQQLEQAYDKYRYEALFGVWLVVTGATFMRIKRQPYSTRLKVEQYESIFKGTSLGAIVLGVAGGFSVISSSATGWIGNKCLRYPLNKTVDCWQCAAGGKNWV